MAKALHRQLDAFELKPRHARECLAVTGESQGSAHTGCTSIGADDTAGTDAHLVASSGAPEDDAPARNLAHPCTGKVDHRGMLGRSLAQRLDEGRMLAAVAAITIGVGQHDRGASTFRKDGKAAARFVRAVSDEVDAQLAENAHTTGMQPFAGEPVERSGVCFEQRNAGTGSRMRERGDATGRTSADDRHIEGTRAPLHAACSRLAAVLRR